jgi:hypothetical protein
LALAIVINGQEIWIGNDDIEQDENAKYSGILKNLEAAIDKVNLAGAGGPASKAVIVAYSTGAELRMPLRDLDKLHGDAFGRQADYRGKIGTDMVQGIVMAQGELSKVTAAHKALIVIGDGNDTNDDEAGPRLKMIAAELAKQHVGFFAIVYKSAVSSDGDVIKSVLPDTKTVNSTDGIAAQLLAILAKVKGG